MTHPDDGRLRALLDDELNEAEAAAVRAHLSACTDCGAALVRSEEVQALTRALLASLDAPAPTERVRARLAERRGERAATAVPLRARERRSWVGRSDLARAAGLALLFTGAVAAAVHPASPLRRWLAGEPEVATSPTPAEAPVSAAAGAPREVGVRVSVSRAGARVTLTGAAVARGTTIELTWVDEGAAAVYAPEGTTFTTSDAEGRIDAVLVPGPVRIELPRSAPRASLRVDGRVWLEKTGERIDYPGPPALVEGARVRFQIRQE